MITEFSPDLLIFASDLGNYVIFPAKLRECDLDACTCRLTSFEEYEFVFVRYNHFFCQDSVKCKITHAFYTTTRFQEIFELIPNPKISLSDGGYVVVNVGIKSHR